MGRPEGTAATTPRDKSLAQLIVKTFDKTKLDSIPKIRSRINELRKPLKVKSIKYNSTICSALDRWRPDWRKVLQSRR